jgi:hypothetical protein
LRFVFLLIILNKKFEIRFFYSNSTFSITGTTFKKSLLLVEYFNHRNVEFKTTICDILLWICMYCLKLYLLYLIIIALRATGKISLLLLTVLPSWNKSITYLLTYLLTYNFEDNHILLLLLQSTYCLLYQKYLCISVISFFLYTFFCIYLVLPRNNIFFYIL